MNIFIQLIDDALAKAVDLDIYTFAIYHDHEGDRVSICIDTKENSKKQRAESIKYSMQHFNDAITQGDLEEAMLWQTDLGRNLSLGDFVAVNISEKEISGVTTDDDFYLSMVLAIKERAKQILANSSHGSSLLFCSSTADEEVGLVWLEGNN